MNARTIGTVALLGSLAHGQLVLRASSAIGGGDADGASKTARHAISADGRRVVFESAASNLVVGDAPGSSDVFVFDVASGVTELVSALPSGLPANDFSAGASISANGRFVAFASSSSALVPGDSNGTFDAFVRDLATGTTELVSVSTGGAQGDALSDPIALSADGRFVLFESFASNLVAGDVNGVLDVFVRDRLLGTTVCASAIGGAGGTGGDGHSTGGAISADGRFVAFESLATNLVAGDANGVKDVYLADLAGGTIELVSVAVGGGSGDQASFEPAISADGRFVAFTSSATDLVALDTNHTMDVFVRDRVLGTTTRVSTADGGAQVSGDSMSAAITYDGRFVAFHSTASSLVPGDQNAAPDVFVWDARSGEVTRASVAPGGVEANGRSLYPSISADGRRVALTSRASNFVADANNLDDAFVVERAGVADFRSFCAGDGLDPEATTPCPCANFGALGRGCASSVSSAGARLEASGVADPDSVVLAASGMPANSGCVYLQGDALADTVFGDGVRCIGGALFRLRAKTNVAGASSFPDATDTISLSARGGVVPGSGVRRWYQTTYRNAAATFCPPETFNVTNGWIVDW